MKNAIGYLAAGVLAAVAGAGLLKAGQIERDLAQADRRVATMDYAGAEAAYRGAERYLLLASRLPFIGNGPVNDIRTREAALHYWQGDYSALVPAAADPVASVAADNVGLQFVIATTAYRAAQAKAKDRQSSMTAIDAGISAYATVLKNAKHADDAAYNFEFLVKIRDDVERGRRKNLTTGTPSPLGSLGFITKELQDTNKFKILVPLDSEERNKVGNAGKGEPKPRKG